MKYEIKDCPFPFESLQIMANGDVRVCCWGNLRIGNLNESTIDELWFGKFMEELREYITNGKIHSMCKDAACPYIQGYNKTI